MPRSRTSTLALAVLAFALIPATAMARPTSTYVLDHTHSETGQSSSFTLVIEETGAGTLHLSHLKFDLIDCDGAIGSRTTSVALNGPVDTLDFQVDRKLTSWSWNGEADVESTVTTYCPETGYVTEVTSESWAFALVGTASDRLSRSRVDGARVLVSTLDTLTVRINGVEYLGSAMLTETISK